MIVEHDKLYKQSATWSWDDCFRYSKQCEQALADLLGIPCMLAPGRHSEFDFTDTTTGLTYEVKFHATEKLKFEFRQSTTHKPSGVSVSTADYWLLVSMGERKDGTIVGKIRKYKLADLERVCEQAIRTGHHNGTQCWILPNDIPHEWLGDVEFDPIARIFDLTKLKRAPGEYIKPKWKRSSTASKVGVKRPAPPSLDVLDDFNDVPF